MAKQASLATRLFSGSPRGASASVFLYNLVETAKANSLESQTSGSYYPGLTTGVGFLGRLLRYVLIPYLIVTAAAFINGGFPVMRALALTFPDEPEAWTIDVQSIFPVVPGLTPGLEIHTKVPNVFRRLIPRSNGFRSTPAKARRFLTPRRLSNVQK